MGYAIICKARKGRELGIEYLALVDRNKTRHIWWTSDNPELIMKFNKESVARVQASKLARNEPEVIAYTQACRYITEQETELTHHEEPDQSWDAHKSCY